MLLAGSRKRASCAVYADDTNQTYATVVRASGPISAMRAAEAKCCRENGWDAPQVGDAPLLAIAGVVAGAHEVIQP